MRFKLSLMGSFDIRTNDSVTIPCALQARRSLILAYLALQPEYSATRESISGLIWSESSTAQSRHNLRQALVELRKDFSEVQGAPLVSTRNNLQLDAARVEVDAVEYSKLIRSASCEDLIAAAQLSRGEFLAGLAHDNEAISEWIGQQRARFFTMELQLLKTIAQSADEFDGDGIAEVLAFAERLGARDPLDEALQCMVAELYARLGAPDAALRRLMDLKKLLIKQLNCDPEPATVALAGNIRKAQDFERNSAPVLSSSLRSTSEQVTGKEASSISAATGTSRNPPFAWQYPAIGLACATLAFAAVAAGIQNSRQVENVRTQAPISWNAAGLFGEASARDGSQTVGVVFALAVLPFVRIAPAKSGVDTIADRLFADLTTDLSRVPSLRVISSTTMRQFADEKVDVAQLGKALGVDYVIEGSVQEIVETVRVSIALIDVKTRLQVFTERFERGQTEVAALVPEISLGLARRLQISLVRPEEPRRTTASGSGEIDAVVAQGWARLQRAAADGRGVEAADHFNRALQLQPRNGMALFGSAATEIMTTLLFLKPADEAALDRASQIVENVIRTNPRSSLAHYYRGGLRKMRWDDTNAIEDFRRVIELNPSFALAHAQIGTLLAREGKGEIGIDHIRYAMRLSPRDTAIGVWNLFIGEIEFERGNDKEALYWFTEAEKQNPRLPFNFAALAAFHAINGDLAKSQNYARTVRAAAPWLTPEMLISRVAPPAGPESKSRLVRGLRLAFNAK